MPPSRFGPDVPTRTRPPATVGLPHVVVPSRTFHFTQGLSSAVNSVVSSPAAARKSGRPVSGETMLRSAVRPHCGQSAPRDAAARRTPHAIVLAM